MSTEDLTVTATVSGRAPGGRRRRRGLLSLTALVAAGALTLAACSGGTAAGAKTDHGGKPLSGGTAVYDAPMSSKFKEFLFPVVSA